MSKQRGVSKSDKVQIIKDQKTIAKVYIGIIVLLWIFGFEFQGGDRTLFRGFLFYWVVPISLYIFILIQYFLFKERLSSWRVPLFWILIGVPLAMVILWVLWVDGKI